jgi:diguanylate cyclase (GGDEF)-like protein/PAS domain S-box-containing protein
VREYFSGACRFGFQEDHLPAPEMPFCERERLEALRSYAILDTGSDARLDSMTQLAAQIFDVPFALVSLVDTNRQWFKSAVGLPQGGQTPREYAFCAHAILTPGQPLVVEDATQDARFLDNPLVTGEPGIRFYAGIPLLDKEGFGLGTLCVVDTKPRYFPAAEIEKLSNLAAGVSVALELHKTVFEMHEADMFSQKVLEIAPNCIKVLDLDGRLLYINDSGRKLLGLESHENIIGHKWADFWPGEFNPIIQNSFVEARLGNTAHFTGFNISKKGEIKWWENAICGVAGPNGTPTRMLCMSHDITEVTEEREKINRSTAQLSAVLESTTDNVIVTDRNWKIEYANSRAMELIGGKKELVGTNFWAAFQVASESDFDQRLRKAMTGRVAAEFEQFVPSLNMWLEIHAFPLQSGLSVFFRNVSERHNFQSELLYLSRHDMLTGLANRTSFNKAVHDAAAGQGEFAILEIDLDHFKDVNDNFGHSVGDVLLKEAALRLKSCLREGTMVARLGGDEFAVLMPELRNHEDADHLAQRVIAAFNPLFSIDGIALRCGTSIGIAFSDETKRDPEDLLKRADIALYAAKAAGRGAYRVFSAEMEQRIAARQTLHTAMETALDRQEMALHYQPVVALGASQIVGFEALMRWNRPDGSVVMPNDFIPLAEETGLILSLGRWVVKEACRQASLWPDPIWVAVNLSPAQFGDTGLVRAISEALLSSGLPARRLELEITESAFLRDDENTLAVLRDLRKLGVRVTLDDFGTGYASLNYLRRFLFDKIKVDRSFIKDLPDNAESVAILRAVTGMGRSLGLVITAEGVETEQQLNFVRLNGCGEAQGYFYSRPVPAEQTPRLLDELSGDARRLARGGLRER